MQWTHSSRGRAGSGFRAALLLFALARGVGDELAEVRSRLRSPDKWARAQAVEELARIGTRAAWPLVFGALADPKGEVADTAELVLAGLVDPKLVELLGKEAGLRSKDALVRARVAEALGRLESAPTRLLEKGLDDQDPLVRRMSAWSLERLARAGVWSRCRSEARMG